MSLRKADAIDAVSLAGNSVEGFDDESVTEESEGSEDESYSSEEEYRHMIAAAAAKQAARFAPPRPPKLSVTVCIYCLYLIDFYELNKFNRNLLKKVGMLEILFVTLSFTIYHCHYSFQKNATPPPPPEFANPPLDTRFISQKQIITADTFANHQQM